MSGDICENLIEIRQNISSAARASGRRAEDITLVAVTKFVDEARIREALAFGVTDAGESRAQEMTQKLGMFTEFGTRLHLIGQLQTNKVKYVIGKASVIQSVDRLELAAEISRLAAKRALAEPDFVQDVYIEVNIGREPQKGGADPDMLLPFIETVAAMPGICVKGLMCIPPDVGEGEVARYFSAMRELFEKAKAEGIPGAPIERLSMGMSGDYRTAIAEGSNMVRIGSAIFGARPKPTGGKA